MKNKILVFLASIIVLNACKTENKSSESTQEASTTALVKAPSFNADSAYFFVEKQVKFGPRVPESPAHKKCGDYLVATLKKYGCTITEQSFTSKTHTGANIKGRNIIGSINPQASKRIILASHWDSRPIADQDSTNKHGAIDGANDGASGVGVLLEIARTISLSSPKTNVGVDIIFFDVEDGGSGEAMSNTDKFGGFCLGSQYWAANKHTPNYSAYYGVLLDMVGAKNAIFPRENYSLQYAGDVTRNIWNLAAQLGYSSYFVSADGGAITDDHVPVNEIAKIPMVDIIHTQLNHPSQTFFGAWHTHGDDMRHIDRNTLKAVGQVLVQMLYQEQ